MATVSLPDAHCARVEQRKIEDYLLNVTHPEGKSKAKFFLARGFSLGMWQQFAAALAAQGRNNMVTRVSATDWGTRYQVDCHCPTPDSLNPCIRTVWEVAADNPCPRLLTAHPL